MTVNNGFCSENQSPAGNIYLIGFMGTGKSTIARVLSLEHGFETVEMDEQIVRQEQCPIFRIFAEKGEPYFRHLETQLLAELAGQSNKVVSCGGGVAMNPENVALMKQSGTVVLLDAGAGTILERVAEDTSRPLLEGRKSIEGIQQLLDARKPAYQAAADLVISVDSGSPRQIAETILHALHEYSKTGGLS